MIWGAAMGVALLTLAAGCSGDDDEPVDEPTTSSEATGDSTTSTATTAEPEPGTTGTAEAAGPEPTTGQEPGTVEDAVVAAYVGFWEARFDANSPPDPDAPVLAEFATGQALEDVRAEARANLDAGLEVRRAEDPADFRRVTVVEVGDDTAIVQECVVDDAVVVRSTDGSAVNDAVATQSLRGDLRVVDGTWRLERSTLLQRWEGAAGCAVADG